MVSMNGALTVMILPYSTRGGINAGSPLQLLYVVVETGLFVQSQHIDCAIAPVCAVLDVTRPPVLRRLRFYTHRYTVLIVSDLRFVYTER